MVDLQSNPRKSVGIKKKNAVSYVSIMVLTMAIFLTSYSQNYGLQECGLGYMNRNII